MVTVKVVGIGGVYCEVAVGNVFAIEIRRRWGNANARVGWVTVGVLDEAGG